MVSIRHYKTGSILGHHITMATRTYGNIVYELCWFIDDGNVEYDVDNINPSEIGWMTPRNKARKSRQFAVDLSSADGRQFSTVVNPITGTKQHSVDHASLSGTIDDCEPDAEYVWDEWYGMPVKCIRYYDAWNTEHRICTDYDYRILGWFLNTFSWPVGGPTGPARIIRSKDWIGIAAPSAYRFTWGWSPVYLASAGCRTGSQDHVTKTYLWPSDPWPEWDNPPPLDTDDAEAKMTEYLLNYFGSDIVYPVGRPIGVKLNSEIPTRERLVDMLNAFCNTFAYEYGRVIAPLAQDNMRALCTQALDEARFIQSNQLEFWKDIGMTFSEFGALKTFAENLTERITRSPEIKHHAKNITSQIKKRYKLLHGRKTSSKTTVDKLVDADVSKWMSERYLADIVGGQISDSANTYLAHYYGTRLAMYDIEEMSRGLSEFIWTYYSEFRKRARTLHSHMDFDLATKYGPSKTYLNYNLVYNPYSGISELNEIVDELGFSVNFHQVWECIPLSFVVDWVFNITDVLKAIDLQNYITKLCIHYEGTSIKSTIDVSEAIHSRYGWKCDLEFSYYTRHYSPIPTIQPGAIDLVGDPKKHFIQGAALLCSR